MSIAFQCPKCQQAYTVKDDLAGKKVVCRSCKKPIFVPRPGSPGPTPELESAAVNALVEEPVAAVAEAPSTFEAPCPNCMEVVTWDAAKVGKQSPCPVCKRIIRVPAPTDGRPKDWRATDNKPTLARRDVEPGLADAWGRHQATVVDRESLKEAGVIADRKRPPATREQKVKRGLLLVCGGVVAFLGVWWWMGHRAVEKRQASIQDALNLLSQQKDAMPAGVRAEVNRGAAEYLIRQSAPDASAALKHLKDAAAAASSGDVPIDLEPERVILLTDIVLTLADLPGTTEQVRAGERVEWAAVQGEFRRTYQAMSKYPAQREGIIISLQRLTRKLRLAGAGGNPAILSVANNGEAFPGPDGRAEALATVALELLALGDAERKKGEELAEQLKGAAANSPPARVVALFVALKQPQIVASVHDPAAGGEATQAARLGFAEGYARQGDYDQGRKIALMPGRFDERFQALVTVAGVALDANNAQYVGEAVEFLERELANQDLPDWRLIRLARLCARVPDPGPSQRLRALLLNYAGTMSSRAQTVRALTLWELLRAKSGTVTEASVKEITPATALGHLLAWEVLARQSTPANVNSWPEAVRPLGLIGAALGLQDRSK